MTLSTFIRVATLVLTLGIVSKANAMDNLPLSPQRTYKDIVSGLENMAQKHAHQVELFDLGLNDNGTTIKGIKVGNGPIHNLVVGTHHGNEYGSAEVAQAFAEDVAAHPIEGQTIYVIPVLNTSGYDRRMRLENGQDPNRDYTGPCKTGASFNLKSTKALADFLDATPIINSATLHTYWPAVLYPWGVSTYDVETGYTDIFKQIGMAATFMSNYKVANSTVELYPADGAFEDYAYWKHGIWSMLFEMGNSHTPNDGSVKEMIRTNVPGLRNMFVNAPTVRAPDFAFKGKCNGMGLLLKRRNE